MKKFINTDRRHRCGGKLAVIATAITMTLGIAGWAPAATAAGFGDEMLDTFKNGEFDVTFRYRYEFVDQSDNGKKDANASTLLTRLVFRTAKWNGFDVTINMDDVRPVVGRGFNDTRNGKTQYQTVADPKGTNLNIAALTYSGLKDTKIVAGRQRITRDAHRFIGNVGWRQNEQTYDALAGEYQSEHFKVFYSYVDQVNRIFGPDKGGPSNTFSSDSHLMEAAYTLSKAFSVSVYGYLLDLDSRTGVPDAHNASNQTFGVRAIGAPKISDDWTIVYVAEYATQEDYGDNQNNYTADYLFGELGFKWQWFGLKAGYEVLEGNGQANNVFQTPLSTLWAHNGWTDKFLTTPVNGLVDLAIDFSAKVGKGTVNLSLHDFSADTGSVDYGQEVNFGAKWPFGKHYSVLGRLAFYNADKNAPTGRGLDQDTTKAWLMMTAAF